MQRFVDFGHEPVEQSAVEKHRQRVPRVLRFGSVERRREDLALNFDVTRKHRSRDIPCVASQQCGRSVEPFVRRPTGAFVSAIRLPIRHELRFFRVALRKGNIS